mmetsp:Transcript_6910/g.10968  ORF Transcript_6910/g.10968 Transcript_6910/m.10968 type:complete len:223 (+) Transcript_6910:1768-2436(+)
MRDKEKRGDQHRQRDDQQQRFRDRGGDDALSNGKGNQDETELARLREAKGKKPPVAAFDPESARQAIEHQPFDQDHQHGHGNQGWPILEQQIEVDPGTHGDEEEAQEQALERFKVAFQFVPEFGAGQHHAGKECAQSGGEAHEHHQEGDRHHDQQGQRRIHLAQPGCVNEAEHRPCEEHACKDDGGDGANCDQRDTPGGQTFHEAHGGAMVVAAMAFPGDPD